MSAVLTPSARVHKVLPPTSTVSDTAKFQSELTRLQETMGKAPTIVGDDSPKMTRVTQTSHWQGIDRLRREMNASMINRTEETNLSLLGLITGQHVLLVGPPGTGKSMLCDAMCRAISGARIFKQLLSRSSTAQDIMGPVDIGAVHAGRGFRYRVENYLPTAHFAFADEIWNANGAVNNAMLGILNEREFFNDDAMQKSPLITMFAASNLFPDMSDRSELRAINDRFLFRRQVHSLTRRTHLERLYFPDRPLMPQVSGLLTLADIQAAQKMVEEIPYTFEAQATLLEIDAAIRQEGLLPSDRRCNLAPLAGKAAAYLDGVDAVQPHHLVCLRDLYWVDVAHAAKCRAIVTKIASPEAATFEALMDEAEEVMSQIESKARAARTPEVVNAVIADNVKLNTALTELAKAERSPQRTQGDREQVATLRKRREAIHGVIVAMTLNPAQLAGLSR